ncbi:hypothetical protein [Nonomuraea aridisoli]|uniref:DUF1049 domain-containing protein n=1 Tax=Nonomuraea aridisoli TaxID=2070368 RepID=A0A2W2FLG6_9ACTN|nr:hypothetical protein [Nonomuraea aridisoli]PZG22677.1 hypothetical protein C1J01_03385 [Nonomuraea aridisoli]
MIVLGLILALLAGGALYLVLTEESTRYVLFGYTFELNHVEMFLAGAASAAVLALGLWLLGSGSRRTARKHRRLRSAKAEASSRVARLEDEKRELERKLQREHAERERAERTEREQAERSEREHERVSGDRLVARGSDDRH